MAITEQEETAKANLPTRRGFLVTVGALAAGVLAGAVSPAAAARSRRKPRKDVADGPGALQRAIEKDKLDLTQVTDKLRKYELPQATEPAFVFQPLASRRSGK